MVRIKVPPSDNLIIKPVTCDGSEDQLRDCLREYNTSTNETSAIVSGLNCSRLRRSV